MKYAKIILPVLLIMAVGLNYSCRETELIDPNLNIPGLGGDDYTRNYVDLWLDEHYVKPYNVDVMYRWDAAQMYSSYNVRLTPVSLEAVIPMMSAIHDIWFEPYNKVAGPAFIKQLGTKTVVLTGSFELNEDGTFKLGQAEGGRKILLLGANSFDPKSRAIVSQTANTIEHEFAHILHQTKMYPADYATVSAGNYNPSQWYNTSEANAYRTGFVSPYASSSVDDDFAEMLSRILVNGRSWFTNVVLATAATSTVNPNAKAQLQSKEALLADYLLASWGIPLYSDPARGVVGLEEYVQKAIAQVIADAQAQP